MSKVTRADGSEVRFSYDAAGRVASLSIPTGQTSFNYESASGVLTRIAAPGGNELTFGYDGALPISVTWAGEVRGTVRLSYDSEMSTQSLGIDGGASVQLDYDSDRLLVRGGDLTIQRNPDNGLVTATELGAVSTQTQHDRFAHVLGFHAGIGADSLFSASYVRDAMSRITSATERVGGAVVERVYRYDLRGRLTEVLTDGVVTASYEYDANGNRLRATRSSGTVTAVYDDQDRLLQYGDIITPAMK